MTTSREAARLEGSLGVFVEGGAFFGRPAVGAAGFVGVEGGELRLEPVFGEGFGGDRLDVAGGEEVGGGGVELGNGVVVHVFTLSHRFRVFTREGIAEGFDAVLSEECTEEVDEVGLVDLELGDVDLEVPEGGVAHGGPAVPSGEHLFREGCELLSHRGGVARDGVREAVDGVRGGEEFDVCPLPLLGVGWDEGHEGCFILADLHGFTLPRWGLLCTVSDRTPSDGPG